MSDKEKILSCHGHLNYKSIAKVVGCDYSKVSRVMRENGKKKVTKSYSFNNLEIK